MNTDNNTSESKFGNPNFSIRVFVNSVMKNMRYLAITELDELMRKYKLHRPRLSMASSWDNDHTITEERKLVLDLEIFGEYKDFLEIMRMLGEMRESISHTYPTDISILKKYIIPESEYFDEDEMPHCRRLIAHTEYLREDKLKI